MPLSSICVYAGASRGNKAEKYTPFAQRLGQELARRKIKLVYGGGSVGLMSDLAQSVVETGGSVLGIIPRALLPVELSGTTWGEQVITEDMHERKSLMAKHSEAFIALPGGFGTYEEIMEQITWVRVPLRPEMKMKMKMNSQ